MAQIRLSLQPSEAVVAQAAAYIYGAYVVSGRVPDGREEEWIQRSVREALLIARLTDEAVRSDTEMG
jgi:hypothetical protein